MARRTRVLHIIQSLNYGGMERLLADLVRYIDADRFESHILALEYLGRFSAGLESFATLHTADPLPRYSMLWPGVLVRQIRGISPDVVHTHSGVWYKGSLAARRAGVPHLLHTDHGRQKPDPWRDRFLDHIASRRTDAVVAVSAPLGDQLATTIVHHTDRIIVIPNGVDTTAYQQRTDSGRLRRELGIPSHTPIIGSIGRLEWIKGYDVMLAAFANLRSSWGTDATPILVLAGDGSQRSELERYICNHSLQDVVHLLGWRDDVHSLHESFTLFTMSSRSEGTSVSLLEAMSAGLCPVVTDVGGNRAVLGPELSHRLVPSEDPAALAAAWRGALFDPVSRDVDGSTARIRVETGFGIEAMVKAYESLYMMGKQKQGKYENRGINSKQVV